MQIEKIKKPTYCPKRQGKTREESVIATDSSHPIAARYSTNARTKKKMKKKETEIYLKSKVHITLQSGIQYTGTIKELNDESLLLIDKFDENITIAYSHILVIRTTQIKRGE